MRIRLTILFLAITGLLFGQYNSPFNQKKIESDSLGSYTFIVSGHFYGDGSNKSHYPANTLLGNLNWINNSDAKMVVCLGDLFLDVSQDIPFYEQSFFSQLDLPLVNAVGNHDLTGSIYQDNYGDTYFMFELNNDLHLVFDTELDNGDIVDEQLEMLTVALEKVNQGNINNVFIYGHRTVWKDGYNELDGLFTDNTQSIGGTNYSSDVLPLLKKIGANANLFWFSGSLGPAPASFFHFKDEETNLTIVATAIRALPRDAVLIVNVNAGEVSFDTKSFTGQNLEPLENYNVAYWQTEVGEEPFNWRLVPYYIELMLTHRYFWYGVLLSLFGVFATRFMIQWFLKIKRKKNGN